MRERKVVTLYELARMAKRPINECLYLAQESKALRLQPSDTNIYVDLDVFQNHLDKIIIEELKNINGKEKIKED